MKTINYPIPVLTCLFLSCVLNAQVISDPVQKVYKIGGSSEIFIGYANSDKTYTKHGVLDASTTLDTITSVEDPYQSGFMDRRKTASAVGDFNGNGADDVVTVIANEVGEIRISIPLIGEDLKLNGLKEYIDTSLYAQTYTRIRMIAGNFDEDQQDEFAICYDLPDGKLTISLFKTDSVLNIEKIASFKGISYYDRNFDIAAGDVDGDGIDEVVMVKNKVLPTWSSTLKVFISTYDLYILKYDPVAGVLNKHQEKEFILNNKAGSCYPSRGRIINEMRIACGDMNNNGSDEIVVGWSIYYSYYEEVYCSRYILGVCVENSKRYHFANRTYLNTFKLTGVGIENFQNVGDVTELGFGTRGVSEDQHIALTLKCEQIDNLGKAKILYNNSGTILVMGMSDDNLELKYNGYVPGSRYLNIQGNETFVVADLNPDSTALNFNKEVIILQSDKTSPQQISTRYNGKTSMAIASIDEITTETIVFSTSPPFDIPVSSVENIEISSFLAGDFDLNDAAVYIVGVPEITPVSDLQQPIVILNSPPVHFDVIGGQKFDLCNAYPGDAGEQPTFFARYNTLVGDKRTTSVKVDNGFGISSDTRAYAMLGGTGFEAAVKADWEKGRSYYSASSQNKIIVEAKTINTEDFVLRSSMDYLFYKYPVYDRKGEKLGNIAVLNPVSNEFSSAWKSAHDWAHPSYVFNHEPGNILSYKQRRISSDFSTSPGFKSHLYSSVPVHSTGDGSFSFTFENISSEETSYSYSGGVGASLFMKAGIEASVEASLSPLGIGGSVASDVKIGASTELSAYYHNSSLSTHSTELSNTFKMEGYIGRLVQAYDPTARYNITPYIYRSQSGALVLDYIVDIPNNSSWWDHYRTNPDLAFILPWRYATEKGSLYMPVSLKQKTSDIQLYPPIANPGDTVVIIARVHNFSLKTFNNLLKVDYYMGDPVDGGVKLTNIHGETGSSKSSTMIYGAGDDPDMDREEYLTFIWKVPDTVSCSPRIYAVIDPENMYTEIHKNNNVGWNLLNIYDCQECKYVERITQTENIFSAQASVKAYPNPFSSNCQIRFSLPQSETVLIDLYNLAGHKIATLTDEMYGSGEHEVSLNAGDLGNGIYICKITAGVYSEIIKLILIR